MSATLNSLTPSTNGDSLHVDSEWLKSLTFRKSAPSDLINSAEAGDVEQFQRHLQAFRSALLSPKKSQQKAVVSELETLWDRTEESEAFLFLSRLGKSSQRDELMQSLSALHQETSADCEVLSSAMWGLMLYAHQLDKQQLFLLWQWVVRHGQKWMEAKSVCDPEQGFAQLRYLEVCLLLSITLQELKGSPKLLKESIGLIRASLEAATDNDGTPQAQWVPNIVDSLACLARLTLFTDVTGQQLWDKASRNRLHGLFDRVLSFCSKNQIAFTGDESHRAIKQQYSLLIAVAERFAHGQSKNLRKLLQQWIANKTASRKQSGWHLPEESHQSDWANLASLRSGWHSPVDQCVVLHDASMPQLDVVVKETSLFRGTWSHQLTLNGKTIESENPWTCTCWYNDSEVSFMELILEVSETTRVIRQVILLREQHQLLLNHAVHAAPTDEIEYQATLPVSRSWNWEEDSATREAALQSFDLRVRVIPVSNPQSRVTRSSGSIKADDSLFAVKGSGRGRLFLSTVFDWSPKRIERPADWSQLTIAQNSQIETPDQAVGVRYRIGRDQWLLYHSLVEPDVPRTVLGLHTPYETVLAKFNSKGDAEAIVEVEL